MELVALASSLVLFMPYYVQAVEVVPVMDRERPQINNIMGKYINNPGLMFEPNIAGDARLIRFSKRDYNSYTKYMEKLKQFMKQYENANQIGANVIDCAYLSGYRPRDLWDKVCRFDAVMLGPSCIEQQGFGFEDGMPCVAIQMSRIFNWLPEPYNSSSRPDIIKDEWSKYWVTMHCEGADPVSNDNIHSIEYYPKEGFHYSFFPYTGQEMFKNPVVLVRFATRPGVAVNVRCTAWAKNLVHYDELDTGTITFDLLVD